MKKIMNFLALPVICLILAGCLVLTYNQTAPKIEQINKQMADDARREVLASADTFTEVSGQQLPDGVVDVYQAENGAGIAIQLISKGYGGDLNMMVGVDKDGKIAGVKIVSGSETAGVGAKTYESKFTDQYKGKNGQIKAVKNTAQNDNEIVAISGASISSKAVTAGVNAALETYEQVKGVL